MEKELAEQKRKMEAEMREKIVAEERARLKEEMKQKLKGELERAQKLKAEQDRERERERNRLRQDDWRMQQQQQIGKLTGKSEFFWFGYNFVGRHLYSLFYIPFQRKFAFWSVGKEEFQWQTQENFISWSGKIALDSKFF